MGEVNKTNNHTDFFYHAFRNILIIGIPLVIISALVLSLPHSSAEISGSTDNVRLTLSTSCTVNAAVTIAHETSLHGGQKDDNVGNTKLSAFCNDNNGYSIYAVGSSGDIDGNTDLINTVNESYNIHTGVYNENNASNPSSWAMKLTAGTGTGVDPTTGGSVPTTPPTIINGFDNYSTIPNVYTQVAKRTSGTSMITDSDASGSYLNTTYQIYANSYQPAGTYNGKVKYVIVHPNGNIPATPDLNTAFASAGKDKIYRDQSGSGPYYAMQDMNSVICNSVTGTGEVTATQLVDTRDNNLYWVAKLADGYCWMTQNLDLAIGSTNVPLTSENTDISTTASGSGIYSNDTTGGYSENNGVWTWTPASTAITANHTISGTSVSNWTNSTTTPYSAEGGDVYYYTSNSTSDDIKYISLSNCKSAGHTEGECKHYHTGNYYNWTAAIVSNNSSSLTTQYANAPNSVCPKGWRLPVAINADGSVQEFRKLLFEQGIVAETGNTYITDGFNNIRKAPLWFVRAGSIGGQYYMGKYGEYWSSTVNDGSLARNLDIRNHAVYTANTYEGRYSGFSVRCLAR